MQRALGSTALGLSVALLMLSRVGLAADTPTVDAVTLDSLKQLFDTDPATAFEQAEASCLAALDKASFAHVEPLVDMIQAQGTACGYIQPIERVVEAAAPVAERAGNWRVLGHLYGARAQALWQLSSSGDMVAMACRADHYGRLAAEAYGKSGGVPEWFTLLNQTLSDYSGDLDARRAADGWAGPLVRAMGPACKATYDAVEQAMVEGNDADAVAQMQDVLDRITATPAAVEDDDARIVLALALLLWVPGADRLIPTLVELGGVDVRHPGRISGLAYNVLSGCFPAWGGRDDAYHEAIRWAIARDEAVREATRIQPFQIDKFIRLRRLEEADELARAWLRWYSEGPAWAHKRDVSYATVMIHEGTADEVRRALVDIAVRCVAEHPEETAYFRSRPCEWTIVGLRAPPDKRDAWNCETAVALATGADSFPTAEARIFGFTQAADLFAAANRPDLAQQCRALAEAIAADDPLAALQCALASARRLAGEGKWEDAAATLEGPASNQPGTVETLQAALLLQEAYLRTGEPAEAERWYQTASELISELPLAGAERAGYLVAMAGLCDVAIVLVAGETGGQ